MLKRDRFEADRVKQVTVRVATDEASVVDNREIPDICLQHLVAVMLVDKTVTFKSAHDAARMKDPAVLRQRARDLIAPVLGADATSRLIEYVFALENVKSVRELRPLLQRG